MAPPDRVLRVDTGLQRQLALFRLCAGLVSTVASLWLHLVDPGVLSWSLLLASAAFTALWARGLSRARNNPGQAFLALSDRGIHHYAPPADEHVPWSEVAGVWLDEDRLQVVVDRTTGPPLRLEPCYEGVNLYSLLSLVEEQARARGCTAEHPALK